MGAKALQLLAGRLWHHSHWPALCELMTDDPVHVQGRACATSCRRYCSRASLLSYLPWCPSSRIRCAICSAVRRLLPVDSPIEAFLESLCNKLPCNGQDKQMASASPATGVGPVCNYCDHLGCGTCLEAFMQ